MVGACSCEAQQPLDPAAVCSARVIPAAAKSLAASDPQRHALQPQTLIGIPLTIANGIMAQTTPENTQRRAIRLGILPIIPNRPLSSPANRSRKAQKCNPPSDLQLTPVYFIDGIPHAGTRFFQDSSGRLRTHDRTSSPSIRTASGGKIDSYHSLPIRRNRRAGLSGAEKKTTATQRLLSPATFVRVDPRRESCRPRGARRRSRLRLRDE